MKIVYRADDPIMGNLICGMLESQGIQAEVRGEYLSGAFGELPVLGQVLVVVDDQDEAQAEAVLAQFDAGAIALPGESSNEDDSDWESDCAPEI